jgi:uncharacterized membrane protein
MIKKYLATGFITLLPIALTLMIVLWLFDFFSAPFFGITEKLLLKSGLTLENHEATVIFLSRLLALIFLILLTFLLGFFGRRFFFKTFLHITNRLFLRIPFIKLIYRVSKDVTHSVFAQEAKTFQKTILIPFPHSDVHALGFLTRDAPEICRKPGLNIEQTAFIPTSPHPLSGYTVLSSKNTFIDVDMSVEDAFKFLLSCGAAHPGERVNDEKP